MSEVVANYTPSPATRSKKRYKNTSNCLFMQLPNRGNFLEMLEWYKSRKAEVKPAFDELCPSNARMTSLMIQKELAKSCAQEITQVIKEEIGTNLYSILIDESCDISITEQMAMIVRLIIAKYNSFYYCASIIAKYNNLYYCKMVATVIYLISIIDLILKPYKCLAGM